jgi:hypothetical protein
MTSDIDMIYTKLIGLHVICNFMVDNPFIWDRLEAQIIILSYLNIKLKIMNFPNDPGWRHALYQICSASRRLKLSSWIFIWGHLGACDKTTIEITMNYRNHMPHLLASCEIYLIF